MSKETDHLVDHIKTYRGRVGVIGHPIAIELPSHKGQVIDKDPNDYAGYYLVKLDKPAINKETGETFPEIVEAADNLYKLRKPKGILEKLIYQKGLEPGEYSFFFTTGEGRFIKPKVENYSGYLLTRQKQIFSFWMDLEKDSKQIVLTRWKQTIIQPNWLADPEFSAALSKMGLLPSE